MIKAFFAAIIGGVIAFAWTSVSWMVLPFHGENLNQFSNEAEISAALIAGAEKPGIYVIPGDHSLPHEEKMEAMKNGPFLFASVRSGANADYSMNKSMIRGLTASIVAGFIMAILLKAVASRLNYVGRLFYVILIAVFVAIVGTYPNQIWWEFSAGHVLTDMCDIVIGWGLAAIIMAGMIKGKSAKAK